MDGELLLYGYFDSSNNLWKKWKNELAVKFGVHSIPASLLIDRQGIVRAVNLRGIEVAALAEELLNRNN